MTQEEFNKHESIPNRRYYVLMEDVPCWNWLRNEGNTFDWTIIGYNSKEVFPRNEIPQEDIQKITDKLAIEFAEWCLDENHIILNDGKELLQIFKKEKGL